MSRPLAAIVGGAAGAVAFVGIVVVLIWYCLFHSRSASRTSETGSSEPSYQGNFRHLCAISILRRSQFLTATNCISVHNLGGRLGGVR